VPKLLDAKRIQVHDWCLYLLCSSSRSSSYILLVALDKLQLYACSTACQIHSQQRPHSHGKNHLIFELASFQQGDGDDLSLHTCGDEIAGEAAMSMSCSPLHSSRLHYGHQQRQWLLCRPDRLKSWTAQFWANGGRSVDKELASEEERWSYAQQVQWFGLWTRISISLQQRHGCSFLLFSKGVDTRYIFQFVTWLVRETQILLNNGPEK
jgi:hypothetical protein